MPLTNASETAVLIIAVALSLQTVMMAAGCVIAFTTWRRAQQDLREMQASFDRKIDAVTERIDAAIIDARAASRAVERLAAQSSDFVQDAAGVARAVQTAITFPKAMAVSGAASAAKWLLTKWRPSSRRRALGRAELIDDAEPV